MFRSEVLANSRVTGTPDPKKNKVKPPSKSNTKAVNSSPPAPVTVKSTDLPLNTVRSLNVPDLLDPDLTLFQNPKKPLPKMKQVRIININM